MCHSRNFGTLHSLRLDDERAWFRRKNDWLSWKIARKMWDNHNQLDCKCNYIYISNAANLQKRNLPPSEFEQYQQTPEMQIRKRKEGSKKENKIKGLHSRCRPLFHNWMVGLANICFRTLIGCSISNFSVFLLVEQPLPNREMLFSYLGPQSNEIQMLRSRPYRKILWTQRLLAIDFDGRRQ